MTTRSSFRINQPPGTPYANYDRSRRDIDSYSVGSERVELEAYYTSEDDYLWTIVSAPDDATATIEAGQGTNKCELELEGSGGYLVHLKVNDGHPTNESETTLYIGIKSPGTDYCLPALDETNQDNSQSPYDGARGSEEKFNKILAFTERRAGIPDKEITGATYTVQVTDDGYLLEATGTTPTFTLPAVSATSKVQRIFYIFNNSGGDLTLNRAGSDVFTGMMVDHWTGPVTGIVIKDQGILKVIPNLDDKWHPMPIVGTFENASDSNEKWYHGVESISGITTPSPSTDNGIPRWDGTGGNALDNSGARLPDVTADTNVMEMYDPDTPATWMGVIGVYYSAPNGAGGSYIGVGDGTNRLCLIPYSGYYIYTGGSFQDEVIHEAMNSTGQWSVPKCGKIYTSVDDSVVIFELENYGSNSGAVCFLAGDRDPEGNVTADPMSVYFMEDSSDSSIYVKQTGTGNTGWVKVGFHGIDDASVHDGVSGATENNFMFFDSNGLPQDLEIGYDDVAKDTQWEYKFLPIGDAFDGSSPPASIETITSGNGKIAVRKFDDVSVEDVVFPWEVPGNFAGGTVYVWVLGFITETTAPSSGEGIVFNVSGYSIAEGESLSGTFGTEDDANIDDLPAAGVNAQYDRFKAGIAIITVSGISAGELAMLHLERDPTDVDDDYEQDVGVYGILLRYYISLDNPQLPG